MMKRKLNEKKTLRERQTLRALAVVRFGHRPPARPLSQTHRQDRLQHTAPQLARAQCNEQQLSQLLQSNYCTYCTSALL